MDNQHYDDNPYREKVAFWHGFTTCAVTMPIAYLALLFAIAAARSCCGNVPQRASAELMTSARSNCVSNASIMTP